MDKLQVGTDPQDLFAFKLNYNITEGLSSIPFVPLYNGNIAESYWRTASDNTQRKYSYAYDHMNRFLQASYQKPETMFHFPGSYDEQVSYDKNGNITHLERTGEYDDMSYNLQIDDLTYTYSTTNPNQLAKVDDATNNPNGFKDGTNISSVDDYLYDAYGNMTVDRNKGITEIKYNHLNLPTKITFGTTGNIEYFYNAGGVKVRKIVTEGSSVTTTDYLSGFQYINNNMEFFPHAEGYVKNTMGSYNYVFNYTDHLGNIRLSYTKNPTTNVLTILEENNYYPFGLKHRNYNMTKRQYEKDEGNIIIGPTNQTVYDYKFQGQERQDELGLNWDSFKWRNYDYAIGRFMNIDPLAEDYQHQSPYAFCENSTIAYRELEGLEGVLAIFYHGGPTGGGQPTTVKEAGTTGDYFVSTQATAGQNGNDFAGTIIAPGWTSASGVESGMEFFFDNYQEGDSVIIYGYSYGVDVAVDLTEALQELNCDVELLVTVDGSDGPLMNSTVNTTIPSNVKKNVNVYQTEDSGASSSSRSTGSTSGTSSSSSGSSNKSKSGSSNSPGSNGGPNKAADSKKTNVVNRNITGAGTNHGNIQDKAKKIIQPELNRAAAN